MTRSEFKYADNFPTLTAEDIDAAFETISVMFSGVMTLWGVIPEPIRSKKRILCLNLLTAWWLLDTKPEAASGVMGTGGMAVNSKSIGGTSLSFGGMDEQEGMKQLNSNMCGQKALAMIQSAPERFGIYA